VIHISGKRDYKNLEEQYQGMGIPFALFDFLEKMEYAYTAADLVLARAGALTVTEIASFKLPAILIPYPYAAGHQRENALVLSQRHLARIIEQELLTVSQLKKDILEMLEKTSEENERDMQHQLNDIVFPDAAKRLVKEAVSLVNVEN